MALKVGQEVPIKISRWDGGIVNDQRNPGERVCRFVSGFDCLTNPYKMTPYYDSEDGDGGAATSQKQNFCIALRSGTTYKLFALGVKSGATTAEILMKGLDEMDDNAWDAPNNNQASSGATSFNLFVYYKYTTAANSRIFGASGGSRIWSFDPTSVATFDDVGQNVTYTNIAQGCVHPSDDILYIPYDNKIAKNNQGSWSLTALTLPSHYYITSICPYGNYLAIAVAPLSGVGNSRVFLWDRDSSLATISESIDWGTGVLKIIEEIDGYLIGVSLKGGNSASLKDKIIIRYLSGDKAKFLTAIVGGSNTTTLPIAKQKINNRLYFLLSITLGGVKRAGLWSVGRSEETENFVINQEVTHYNDTAIGNGVLKGFFIVEDYIFISSTTNAGAYQLAKTNDQASYTATSVRETQIFNLGDSKVVKKLKQVSLSTAPLPADGQVVLKYAINENIDTGNWVTVFTNAVDDSIYHHATNIESTSANLPEYNEIAFRIESTGGAEITELAFVSDIIGDKVNPS